MRTILHILLGIFFIVIIGNILLDTFPSLVPLFEEGKAWVATAYNMSIVKYGTFVTGILVIGLLILFSDGNRR